MRRPAFIRLHGWRLIDLKHEGVLRSSLASRCPDQLYALLRCQGAKHDQPSCKATISKHNFRWPPSYLVVCARLHNRARPPRRMTADEVIIGHIGERERVAHRSLAFYLAIDEHLALVGGRS